MGKAIWDGEESRDFVIEAGRVGWVQIWVSVTSPLHSGLVLNLGWVGLGRFIYLRIQINSKVFVYGSGWVELDSNSIKI